MRRLFGILLTMMVVMTAGTISAKEFKLPVGQFSKLSVDDNVNVVYVGGDGSPSRVAYSGSAHYAKAFIITQKGNKLRIQVETPFVGDPDLPTLYVYSDFLDHASLSAESTLTLKSVAPGSKLDISLMGNGTIVADGLRATKISAALKTGNGTISLGGQCQTADLLMCGNGTIQADRLQAENVCCKLVMGSGTIGCWAVNDLSIKGIGNTKIYYKGQPVIKKKGGGKVFSIDTDTIEVQ